MRINNIGYKKKEEIENNKVLKLYDKNVTKMKEEIKRIEMIIRYGNKRSKRRNNNKALKL